MRTILEHKITKISIFLSVLFIFNANMAFAQGGFEFYFFGQNISSFQNGNWLKATAGAVASLCIHEVGHALYLESIGKSWNLNASITSGFSIRTDENMTDTERGNFGRAGFALQSLVGTGLTLFEKTRNWDFTKGWVAMSTTQVFTYQGRRNDNDDDFAMIEKGGGKSDLEYAAFSFLSFNNWMRLENDSLPLATKAETAPDFNPSDNFYESEGDSKDEFVSYRHSPISLNINSPLQLPHLDPQKAMMQSSSWGNSPKLTDLN